MEQYTQTSYQLCILLTKKYSTSFSASSRLFHVTVRRHIYAIYALARIADEVVDTYNGKNVLSILNSLENEVVTAVQSGYSTNPIIHAFADTANKYDIGSELLRPFFESMREDITKKNHTVKSYHRYIYGSAEVIGLMCLKVFCNNDDSQYKKLASGAKHLGAAYQKINFLRDIKEDHEQRDRFYFPGSTYQTFNDAKKGVVIKDIQKDMHLAKAAVEQLPPTARTAVKTSYLIYEELLHKLTISNIKTLKTKRIRVSNLHKIVLLVKGVVVG